MWNIGFEMYDLGCWIWDLGFAIYGVFFF